MIHLAQSLEKISVRKAIGYGLFERTLDNEELAKILGIKTKTEIQV